MGIAAKHAYRFGYLKSEHWSNVRIEALAREKGKCQICSEESISNDAHHIWYPDNIYETRADQLVILCRPCHDFLHSVCPEAKTPDEDAGRAEWLKFSNAIFAWRRKKAELFFEDQGLGAEVPAKELRVELVRLRQRIKEFEAGPAMVQTATPKQERAFVMKLMDKWFKAYCPSGADSPLDK